MNKALALLSLALSALVLVACGGGGNNTTTPVSRGSKTGGGQATTGGGGGGGATTGGGGGTGGGTAAGSGQTLHLSADPSGALAFNTKSLSAKAGKVTIDLDNPAAISHDVAVDDSSGKKLGAAAQVAQGTTSLTLTGLKPGKYTFYCSVPGHRQAGMEGTLTVK
jgi:plastocyanin